MVWKIIEYNDAGIQTKKHMGDTETGLRLSLRQVICRQRRYHPNLNHTFQIFIIEDEEWEEANEAEIIQRVGE